jgi:hypothetical protein
MFHKRHVSLYRRSSRPQPVLVFQFILAIVFLALPTFSTSATISVNVDPQTGSDFDACGVTIPCKSIFYAVTNISASIVNLAAGIFNESTINISGQTSVVISGVESATVFDCSARLLRSGAAFHIINSTITFFGVTFKNCFNLNSNGGAVSAVGSSIHVTRCSFMKCSAPSGGAISVTGPGNGLFLKVLNSSFLGNSAQVTQGGLSACPNVATQPCSVWGGAIAAFDILNVTISGCTMEANNAQAIIVPNRAKQISASSNVVAGGGCVSLLFFGNTSRSTVFISGNTFLRCTVNVGTSASSNNVILGNGMNALTHLIMFQRMLTCAQDMEERCPSTSVSQRRL